MGAGDRAMDKDKGPAVMEFTSWEKGRQRQIHRDGIVSESSGRWRPHRSRGDVVASSMWGDFFSEVV